MRRAGRMLLDAALRPNAANQYVETHSACLAACSNLSWTKLADHLRPICSAAAAATCHTLAAPNPVPQLGQQHPPRYEKSHVSSFSQQFPYVSIAAATFSTSSSSSSSSSNDSISSSSSSSSSPTSSSTTLQASMDKLVDTAVGLVEEGKLQQAIEVLQQGVQLLTTTFPDSPELSELHNQAALLLLFAHQHEAAAKHAADALDITQTHFGPVHPLTGHRLLRLGSIRVAAGQLQEAQPLLAAATDMLANNKQSSEDPSISEALFYLNILGLAAADTSSAVAALTPGLQEPLKHLVATLGPESMIVRMALSAHSQQVGRALDHGITVGEAAFKQHISLQEIQDPNSAELGLTLYQLATTYYAHDMLPDAGSTLQGGSALLSQHYPSDHDLVMLCKHRLGMICAAGRDYKSATLLLGDAWQHYSKQQEGHPLAQEANFGLAMARVKGMDPRISSTERDDKIREELSLMRSSLAGMATVLGAEHLLVTAASRYLAQLAVMTGQSVPTSS